MARKHDAGPIAMVNGRKLHIRQWYLDTINYIKSASDALTFGAHDETHKAIARGLIEAATGAQKMLALHLGGDCNDEIRCRLEMFASFAKRVCKDLYRDLAIRGVLPC